MLPKVSETPLIAEWAHALNQELDPSKLTGGSGVYAWWECQSCAHQWRAQISSRRRGASCPVCCERKLSGSTEESIAVTHPAIAAEWDTVRNHLKSEQVTAGSARVAYWLCSEGHSYRQKVGSRCTRGLSCQICAHRLLLPGFNDLATMYPAVAAEWDNEANKQAATEVSFREQRKARSWRCSEGHQWSTNVRNRTILGSGCPACSRRASKLEKTIREALQERHGTAFMPNRRVIAPLELDAYAPALGIAFEVNGTYWHSDAVIQASKGMSAVEYHRNKVELAHKAGVTLGFIWQADWLRDPTGVLEASDIVVETRGRIMPGLLSKLS